jgi:hypothetical protein
MDIAASLSHWTPWIDAASVVAVAVGVAKAFDWFDGLISDESRVTLWYYLADVPSDERIESWGTVFPKLVDKVFGEKALSWKFVLRSCAASLIAVALMKLAFIAIVHPPDVIFLRTLQAKDSFQIEISPAPPFDWPTIVKWALLLNFIPDFLSLLVSRWIVREMARRSTNLWAAFLLVVDLAITLGIAVIAVGTAVVFVLPQHGEVVNIGSSDVATIHFQSANGFQLVNDLWHHNLSVIFSSLIDGTDRVYSYCFYAAFFTSIWVWLYVLSIFSIKLVHKVRPLWLKLLPYLDIEKRPMQAIGRIAGVIAGLGYALILGIVWMSHH